MVEIPKNERERILKMATTVREEQFEACDRSPLRECDLASHTLSSHLRRMGIPHGIAYGQFYGPIDWEAKAIEAEGPEFEVDRGHMFIVFPQWGNAILDITADQFTSKAPSVWFPANPKWYVDYDYDEVRPFKRSKFSERRPVRVHGYRRRR